MTYGIIDAAGEGELISVLVLVLVPQDNGSGALSQVVQVDNAVDPVVFLSPV